MKKGYIALTSVIIVSILILTIVSSLSFSIFFGRFNILDSENKESASALAEACADKALLKLAQNSSYQGNENAGVGTETCFIFPIELLGNQKIIKVKASKGGAVSNFKITVNNSDFSIASWIEENSL